jgi:hypothetical protein
MFLRVPDFQRCHHRRKKQQRSPHRQS